MNDAAATPAHFSLDRRDLIRAGLIGFTGFTLSQGMLPVQAFALPARRKAKAVVMLWMSGGPSQIDTWDPKPDHANGGETKAIESKVKGLMYTDNFPILAKEHAEKIAILRSVQTNIVDHQLGDYFVHTGYAPDPSVVHPNFGSIIAKEFYRKEDELPGFVSIGGGTPGEGFLPATFAPFMVGNPSGKVPNLEPWAGVDKNRMNKRLNVLGQTEKEFKMKHGHELVQKRHEVYDSALKLMEGKAKAAFDLSTEPPKNCQMYGMNGFGLGCLMARKLLQAGVKFVEVRQGGWDTHRDNFRSVANLCKMVDQGFSALLTELSGLGMLSETLVIWAGEFGRTPNVNADNGRDHWGKLSIAMAGAGINAGFALGSTSEDGTQIAERPIDMREVIATIYDRLGINPNKQNYSPEGRPIRLVRANIDGETVTPIPAIKELL
jgi:hypothetical protein